MSSVSAGPTRVGSRGPPSRVSVRAESNTAVRKTTSATTSNTKKTRKSTKSTGDVLKAKEEEYMRLNAELEAKTSELVKEAEDLIKGNLSILSDLDSSVADEPPPSTPSPLHSSHPHSILQDDIDPSDQSTAGKTNTGLTFKETTTKKRPNTSGSVVSKSLKSGSGTALRPQSSSQGRPLSNKHPTQGNSHIHNKKSALHPADPIRTDVEETVQLLKRQLDISRETEYTDTTGGYHGDDILPAVAEGMGPDATIRFLKAKLRVMQEEMDRLCQESNEKEKALSQAESKLKEITDQSSKIQRSYQTTASQVDKYKHLSETFKHKCEGLATQLVSLRKEVDSMKGSHHKATSQRSAVEVRLNRALEETEKYKTALQKAQAESKESSKQDKQRVEQLTLENKQLEKQKNELVTAFKKQMKLIDIIKRQKMHIEAAKMLSFTEEQFVKALDWGSS